MRLLHWPHMELVERVRRICLALPEVTEKPSHGAPTFFVKKSFVMVWADGHHDDRFPHLWCAAPPGAQAEMVASEPERFLRLQEACPLIADVRGHGAMQALEFCFGGDATRPAGEVVKAIMHGCFQDGLLVITAGAYGNVIRTLPPLSISDDQLNQALDILERQILKHGGS